MCPAGREVAAELEEHPDEASAFGLPEAIKLGLGDLIFYISLSPLLQVLTPLDLQFGIRVKLRAGAPALLSSCACLKS